MTSSRCYSGSSLLRNEELILMNPVHIGNEGIKILTLEIEKGKGTVSIEIEDLNENVNIDENIRINYVIKNKNNEKDTKYLNNDNDENDNYEIKSNQKKIIKNELTVEKPLLWSDEDSNLYSLEIEIIIGGEIEDKVQQKFVLDFFV